MTASEPEAPLDEERSLAEKALEVLVYVPAGVLATALEDMPEMAAKGRARVEQQLRNAHVVGRFAVDYGIRQIKQQVESVTTVQGGAPHAATRGQSMGASTTPGARRASAPGTRRPRTQPPTVVVAGARSSRDPEVDRAIPDYDALSASQVVRRLDGLDAKELRAVERHERSTRRRRTILHRAEQLLEMAPPPPPGSPATP